MGPDAWSVWNKQEKLEASVAEINKGNQIIQKIQTEYRGLKVRARRHAYQSIHWSLIVCTCTDMLGLPLACLQTKLRLKSEVMKQQERLLEEREHALEDANRRLQAAADSRASLEEHVERLKKDLATATTKLEESNRLIESNQQVRRTPLDAAVWRCWSPYRRWRMLCCLCRQVITWLNKEINEAQLGRGAYATTPTAAFTPVTSPSSSVPCFQTHAGLCMRSVDWLS